MNIPSARIPTAYFWGQKCPRRLHLNTKIYISVFIFLILNLKTDHRKGIYILYTIITIKTVRTHTIIKICNKNKLIYN